MERTLLALVVAASTALGCTAEVQPLSEAELGSTQAELTSFEPQLVEIPGLTEDFTVWQVSPHAFMMRAYANCVLYDTGEGLVLVDTMTPIFFGGNDLENMGIAIDYLAAEGLISTTEIRYIANTHWHPDHMGHNAQLRGPTTEVFAARGGTLRTATDQFIAYFGAPVPAWPEEFWPDAEVSHERVLAGGRVVLHYAPYSHTTTDLVVTLPEERLVIVGDLILAGWLAFTDHDNGGSTRGLLATVDHVLDFTPSNYLVIPGHNDVMTRAEARLWHDAHRDALDYVEAAIAAGDTLAEIQAAAVLPPSQGGMPASVHALDSPVIPIAAFVDFAYRDVTERDLKALVVSRVIASFPEVRTEAMVAAILAATAGGEDAAGTEYDTLGFQVDELAAIDSLPGSALILTPGARQAYAIYTEYVEEARAAGSDDLTLRAYLRMLAELARLLR